MQPVIDHIHITVSDLKRAERFYDMLLPLLGFDIKNKEIDMVPEHEYQIIEYNHRNFSIGLVSPRSAFAEDKINRRKPGALHHLAFAADSRADVDRLYRKILKIGAQIVHKPQEYPEYCADYYAFFFKDFEGIELEIVYFNRPGYFEKKSDMKWKFPKIREIEAEDRQAVNDFIKKHWLSVNMVVRGQVVDMTTLDGFIASEKKLIVGLVTYRISDGECEIMSLDSIEENHGIGTALLNCVIRMAESKRCKRVKLITTNDNIRAILFYQKRGFDMARLYRNALDVSRRLKPEIPLKGDFNLPIRHEIEFELLLSDECNNQ